MAAGTAERGRDKHGRQQQQRQGDERGEPGAAESARRQIPAGKKAARSPTTCDCRRKHRGAPLRSKLKRLVVIELADEAIRQPLPVVNFLSHLLGLILMKPEARREPRRNRGFAALKAGVRVKGCLQIHPFPPPMLRDR